MADKGRDLKVSVLSDADQFDLAQPARDLDQLADAAQGAGRELSQLDSAIDTLASLGDDATGAARDVKKLADSGDELRQLGAASDKAGADVKGLGTDADQAAASVDGAMDKIAQASKRAANKVDDSMDQGGRALDDFKEEAASSGTEAAASFSGGFDDVTDFIQETIANGLASVGKVGMAAGIAAAAGLGFVVSAAQAASEKVDGIRTSLLELQTQGLTDTASKVQAVLDEMRDTDTLQRFAAAAQTAGIDFNDYVRALANGGPEAERMKARLEELTGAQLGFATIAGDGKAAHDLINRMGDQERAAEGARIEADALAAATSDLGGAQAEASVQVQGMADAVAGFSDSTAIYTGLLTDAEQAERDRADAVAKGTKSSKDSWEDYARSVTVSVDQYLDELERQVTAQEGWADNMGKLARRGVNEGVLAELAKMGPQGAPLVAKLTSASDAELTRMADLYGRKGTDATTQLESAIAAGRQGVVGQASSIWTATNAELHPPMRMTTTLTGPPPGQAAAIRRDVQNNMRPVEIPIMLRNVPTSAMSRFIP